MAQEIVFYHSAMQGAPSSTLTTPGAALAVLDACLVDGFNVNSISVLTQAAGIATATTSGTNGYSIGDWVEVAGAVPAAYNGRVKVIGKPGTDKFTYAVPGGTASPASGTMTAKYPGAGWSKTVAGTNIAAYQSGAGSLGHWLQVEDNNPYSDSNLSIRTRIAAGWTALDTAGTLGDQIKHLKLTGGWMLFADARTVWLFVGPIGSAGALYTIAFGEGDSFYGSDGYFFYQNLGDSGSSGSGYGETTGFNFSAPGARYFPWLAPALGISSAPTLTGLRNVSQIGGATPAGCAVLEPNRRHTVGISVVWEAFSQDMQAPSLADNTLPVSPIFFTEYASSNFTLRGRLRGALFPLGGLTTGFTNSFQRLDNGVVDGVSQPLVLMTNNFAPNPTTGAKRQLAFKVDGAW